MPRLTSIIWSHAPTGREPLAFAYNHLALRIDDFDEAVCSHPSLIAHRPDQPAGPTTGPADVSTAILIDAENTFRPRQATGPTQPRAMIKVDMTGHEPRVFPRPRAVNNATQAWQKSALVEQSASKPVNLSDSRNLLDWSRL